MQTKALTIQAMDEAGKGLARIATLSAVDHDGDTYAKGAFGWKQGGEQWAPILVAHDRKTMPIGKARVYEEGDAALAELFLNLDTQAGKEWHAALKFDLAKGRPVQQWSYGYEVEDSDYRFKGTNRVREIRRTDVHEVSAVIRGAGVGTGTLAMKGAKLKDDHFAALIGSLGELADALPIDASVLSATGLKQLEEIDRAIGGVLQPLRDREGKQRAAVDSALAGYLKLQARHHLKT